VNPTSEIIEFYKKIAANQNASTPSVKSNEPAVDKPAEPFQSFVVTLAETLKKEKAKPAPKKVVKKKKKLQSPPKQEVISESVKPSAEPLQSFIASLAEVLKHEKAKQQASLVESSSIEEPVVIEQQPEAVVEQPSPSQEYLKVLSKGQKPIVPETEEEKKIKTIVSEQIAQQSNIIRSQYPNVGMGGGGGGTNAVQFNEGGTMFGDLNVTGKYLSGGVDLATLIGTGGGGSTDSLVAGSQAVTLSSNGSFVFNVTDNNIVLTTPLGYTWTFDNNGVLSGPMNTLAVSGINSIGTILSAGVDLFDLFAQKDVVDGGQYT
jgi:hypothetical protein